MNRFKNLKVWERAVAFTAEIYKVTQSFPEEEKYGLSTQMRRSAISISSNIAEGAGRGSSKEFSQFLKIAYGSSYELETQLLISKNLKLLDPDKCNKLIKEVDELQKMIYSLSKSILR